MLMSACKSASNVQISLDENAPTNRRAHKCLCCAHLPAVLLDRSMWLLPLVYEDTWDLIPGYDWSISCSGAILQRGTTLLFAHTVSSGDPLRDEGLLPTHSYLTVSFEDTLWRRRHPRLLFEFLFGNEGHIHSRLKRRRTFTCYFFNLRCDLKLSYCLLRLTPDFWHPYNGRQQASACYFLWWLSQKSFGVRHQDHPDQTAENGCPDADKPRFQRLHGLPVEMGGERPQCDSEPRLSKRGFVPYRHPDGQRSRLWSLTWPDEGIHFILVGMIQRTGLREVNVNKWTDGLKDYTFPKVT